ncbi:hypothetical protein ACF1BE_19825 [Streptomyces sp. NPDC014991]|uniref:hypothetical protein n=1 Tax=Streptomyces sp. NPDC014991 TaxID=3364935 RepID=UPI0036FABCE9
MTHPITRAAHSARATAGELFRGAQAGAGYALDLFGPIGLASLVAGTVILLRL